MYSDLYFLVKTKQDWDLLLGEIDILVNSLYKLKDGKWEEVLATKVRKSVAEKLAKYKDQMDKIREVIVKMRTLKLITAVELPQTGIDKISDWVKSNLGEDVVLEITLDPAIIGGSIVYWNGKIGDFSLKKKLESYSYG